MLRKRANLILLALVVPVMAFTGCGKKGIVTVNGKSVSKDEFYARLERVPVQTGPNTKRLAGEFVAEQMIVDELVKQLADKESVTPTGPQIDAKITFMNKQSGGTLNQVLASQGSNMDEYRKQLTTQQARINIVTKGIDIPDSEVKAAYDKALAAVPSPFKMPAAVKMSVIIVAKKDKIDKAYQMLKEGTDFGVVAAQISELANAKETKGALPWLPKNDSNLPAVVKQKAFSLEQGKYCEPFLTAGTWVIIKVDDTRPEKTFTFDDVKSILKEELAVKKGLDSGEPQKKIAEFVKSADISVSTDRFKGVAANVKKQAADSLTLASQKPTAASVVKP